MKLTVIGRRKSEISDTDYGERLQNPTVAQQLMEIDTAHYLETVFQHYDYHIIQQQLVPTETWLIFRSYSIFVKWSGIGRIAKLK